MKLILYAWCMLNVLHYYMFFKVIGLRTGQNLSSLNFRRLKPDRNVLWFNPAGSSVAYRSSLTLKLPVR